MLQVLVNLIFLLLLCLSATGLPSHCKILQSEVCVGTEIDTLYTSAHYTQQQIFGCGLANATLLFPSFLPSSV